MSAPESDERLRPDMAIPPARDGELGDRHLSRRSVHLAVLVLGIVFLLFWYRHTVASLVEIWQRSDTYAHGFLVAPISGWLIWRVRDRLRDVPLAPSLLGLLAGVAAGFAWLLGELASVASVSEFALVGMVVALVWAVTGTAAASRIAFPLGFLFFSVPFGEFLFPWMMDRTADFVIGGLRLSGVPVYAEGRNLVIPSGNWAVVEGCSGVRYLIASVVVGSLYAYLTYRSLRRRLIFTAVAVVLPVFANWLRAYGIVMLAHLSGNRIAAGVDHLVYGWVFFGLVMFALFWIGGRWREDEDVPSEPKSTPLDAATAAAAMSPLRGLAWTVVALAAVLAWKPVLGVLEAQGQHGAVTFSRLEARGPWRPAAERLPEWSPRYSGMQGELRAGWKAAEAPVGVYIAYYRDQKPGKELINSENRVLLNKDPLWRMAAYGEQETRLGPTTMKVRSTEIFNDGGRMLVWNWYWIGGRWTSSDYVAKFYQAVARLSGGGDDSAAVMVYAPFAAGSRKDAETALEAFVRDMGPAIGNVLQQTRGR
jgi:exosortase A